MTRKILLVLALIAVPAVALADYDWLQVGLRYFDQTNNVDQAFYVDMPEEQFIASGLNSGTSVETFALVAGDGIAMDDTTLEVDMPAVRSALTPTTASATHAIGSCFQISSTRPVRVGYSVTLSSILTTTSATVFLESFTDSGCTTGTVELGRYGIGGVAVNPSGSGQIVGEVATGAYMKLRLAGTATAAVNSGWETTL